MVAYPSQGLTSGRSLGCQGPARHAGGVLPAKG